MAAADREKAARGAFDLTMRHLAQEFPEDFAFLSLGRKVDKLEVLSSDLPASEKRADWLVKVTLGTQTFILHVEFQTAFSREKILALLEYRVRARVLYGLPVFSVMVYLTDEGHPGAGSNRFEEEEILGQRQHVFVFHEVRLWELDARRFLEAGPEGLLPLVPLMRAEQEEEPLRQAIARATEVSDNRQRADLLAAIVIFGSLRHPEQVISNLIRREEMKESSIVQSFIEEGRAEGREEGIQRGREEGVQRGREEGIQRGREEGIQRGREEGVQKGALIGEIRACQRFLRQRPSPQSMLLKKSPDELRRLADALEREVNERQK